MSLVVDDNVVYLPVRQPTVADAQLTLEAIDECRARALERYTAAVVAGDDLGRCRALVEINHWRIARAQYLQKRATRS